MEKPDFEDIDWDSARFTKREVVTFSLYAIGQVNMLTALFEGDVVSACRDTNSKEKCETLASVFGFLAAVPEAEIQSATKEVRALTDQLIVWVKEGGRRRAR